MLRSTALISPLRRRVARAGLQSAATRGETGLLSSSYRARARKDPVPLAVFSNIRYDHASASKDDIDESHRYRLQVPISIVSNGSASMMISATLRGTLGLDPLLQVRHLNTAGPPTRSSTSAAHPSFSSSSAPTSGRSHDDDDHEDHDDDHHLGRFESAKEKGRAYAKRGRKAAKKGGAAAKKGAIGFKDMIQKYGFTFLGTYFGLYFGTLAALFAGIDSGLLDPASVMSTVKWIPGFHGGDADGESTKTTVEMVAHFLERYEFTKKYSDAVMNNPHSANLGIAWIATKFTEPVRLGTTFAIVPRVHRALGRDVPKAEHEHDDHDHELHEKEETSKNHGDKKKST